MDDIFFSQTVSRLRIFRFVVYIGFYPYVSKTDIEFDPITCYNGEGIIESVTAVVCRSVLIFLNLNVIPVEHGTHIHVHFSIKAGHIFRKPGRERQVIIIRHVFFEFL